MTWLARLIDSFRSEPRPDPLKAIQPRVTPDPQQAEALARRWAEVDYYPENGFALDTNVQRCPSNVIPLRRRAR